MARWLRSHHELDADVHRESSYREALCDSCVDTRVVGFYGCDPVINVAGAKFHAWLFCVAVVAALFRLLLIALRIDHHLWPAPLVYLSLAVLAASVVYVTCFNRI